MNYHKKEFIIGIGACTAMTIGYFVKAPGVTDFFSYCIGFIVAGFVL